MKDNKEIWEIIEGYPNYAVSNLGRVKNILKNRCISLTKRNGYLTAHLCKDGISKRFSVHRLVAKAFIPNPENLPMINHKDEDKTNNMVWVNDDDSIDYNKTNLEWCTAKYNNNYGTRVERISKPILQFSTDGEFIKRWSSMVNIEKELGIPTSNICECCKNRQQHTAKGYVWGYESEFEKIPFKMFNLEIYRKKAG